MDISNWYNNTMSIFAYDETRDSSGSWTRTGVEVHANVPCRIRAKTGIEQAVLGKLGSETTHRIYCETTHNGSAIELNPEVHYIIIGTTEYDITFPNDPHEVGDFLQIDVTQRT